MEGTEEQITKEDEKAKEESPLKDGVQVKEEKLEESVKYSRYPVPGYSDEENMW